MEALLTSSGLGLISPGPLCQKEESRDKCASLLESLQGRRGWGHGRGLCRVVLSRVCRQVSMLRGFQEGAPFSLITHRGLDLVSDKLPPGFWWCREDGASSVWLR